MPRRHLRPKRVRRSYLLLEVLLSLALVTACLFPLLKPHLAMRKGEIEQLQKMQFDRLSHVALADLKVLLYEHIHTWGELENGISGTLDKLPCTYHLKKVDGCHKKSTDTHYLLLEAEIIFPQRTYTFPLFLEQHKRGVV